MAQNWYVQVGDQVLGPHSAAKLRQGAETGKLSPDTLVRKGEDGEWFPASKLKGLFDQETVPQFTNGDTDAAASPVRSESGSADDGTAGQSDGLGDPQPVVQKPIPTFPHFDAGPPSRTVRHSARSSAVTRLWRVFLVIVAPLLAVGGVTFFVVSSEIVPNLSLKNLTDPHRTAIRGYLDETVADPDYQIVKWFPTRRGQGQFKNRRYIRVRYRFRALGGWGIRDQLLVVRKDRTVFDYVVMRYGESSERAKGVFWSEILRTTTVER